MKTILLIILMIIAVVAILCISLILTINFSDEKKTTVSDTSKEQLEAILEYCIDSKDLVDTVGLSYYNDTHFIDTVSCKWQKHNRMQIDSEGLDTNSTWITEEDYCDKECDQDDFDKTFDGPGNRHPAFLGFDIPEICTDEMIKHLDRYSSMFESNVHYAIEDIGLENGTDINDFDRCVKELLEKNPRNTRKENRITIEGQMADQICAITGGQCPPYYIGNPQEDGSVMIGMTFSEGTKETFYVFLVKNGTLSYEVKENGK